MTRSGRSLLGRLRGSVIGATVDAARLRARAEGVPLYLVGGCVRDLLAGRPLRDVDLVVEGDAFAFAGGLARELGARRAARSAFGTCRVETPGGLRIDLATARRERYARPAALPRVEPAPIEEDLLRRDLTINALALGLSGRHEDRLLDPAGGAADLALRRLRLLHPGSLIDDPTRAFRGARYAARFGLRPGAGWRAALRAADRAGAFPALSAARLRREIEVIAEEPDPAAVVRLAGAWGLWRRLDPALGAGGGLVAAVRRGCDAVPPPRGDGGRRLLVLLTASLPPARRRSFAARLGLTGRTERVILEAAAAPGLASRWARPGGTIGFARAETLARLSPDARAALAGYAALLVRRAAAAAVARWERARPELGAADLLALGVPRGPEIGRILRRLRAARYDGRLGGREAERNFVRRLLDGVARSRAGVPHAPPRIRPRGGSS